MTEQTLLHKIEWVNKRDPLSQHQIDLLKFVFASDVKKYPCDKCDEACYYQCTKGGQQLPECEQITAKFNNK